MTLYAYALIHTEYHTLTEMRNLTIVEAQWLFKKSELDHTPSRAAGITLEDELQRRKTTIQYIESIGLRIGLGHGTPEHTSARGVIAVAATLVHRFYMRRSFEDFKETLMAPTILFLASKIEEEPLKLRHIVNACLTKWDPNAQPWHVDVNSKEHQPQQSTEYQAWEREILATEELALEALCFDMGVEHPFPILQRSVMNLSKGNAKGKEVEVVELAWPLLTQISYSPIPVLHHPHIIAMSVFVMIIALSHDIPLEEGLAAAGGLGPRFGLDAVFDQEKGLVGKDAEQIRACCNDMRDYSRQGLINEEWITSLQPEPEDRPAGFTRRLTSSPANGHDQVKTPGVETDASAANAAVLSV